MLNWLLSPVDPSRVHEVGALVSWHARSMVLAWGVLVPVGIVAARYFKVTPKQPWPEQLDSHAWWITHRVAQYTALALMVLGLGLILSLPQETGSVTPYLWVHRLMGWSALAMALHQLLSGVFRGSKGGPTDPAGQMRGDHYDMTPRRLLFERLHKTIGHLALALAVIAILTGLWQANAPYGLWILILGWWGGLAGFLVLIAPRLRRVPTYQAIWGPSPEHPGNRSQDV